MKLGPEGLLRTNESSAQEAQHALGEKINKCWRLLFVYIDSHGEKLLEGGWHSWNVEYHHLESLGNEERSQGSEKKSVERQLISSLVYAGMI